MVSLFIYAVATIAYTVLSLSALSEKHWPHADLVPFALGFLGLAVQIHQQLQVCFLRYYFLWTRAKQCLTNPTSRWALNADLRGAIDVAVIETLKGRLLDGSLFRFPAKIYASSPLSLNFAINESLNFYLEIHPRAHSGSGMDTCGLKMATIEIGSNAARRKLDQEVVPILDAIQNVIRPERVTYELNIDFLGANPFYSRYMQHLKADEISDFKINLLVTNYTASNNKERVEISKEGVHIFAHTSHSMKELAKDFLFQSPNLGKLLPAQHAQLI